MTQILNSEEEEEEKLEFLKREEIQTMAKDIARLREIEAQKERERITTLKPEKKITPIILEKPSPPISGARETEKERPTSLIPKLPKKPSFPQKILVRAGIVLILFFIIGFFYWFFVIKNKPPEEAITPPEEETVSEEEIIIPPPLIGVKETKTFEISETEEIQDAFNQLMAMDLAEGTFTQILIKNLKENRLVSLNDIASAFQIEIPAEIYPKLDENITFTIFSQKQGSRLAFLGKVKEADGLLEILKNWEKEIEKNGVSLSDQKIKTSASQFKTAYHNKVGFRYLTISSQDFGICYAWFDDYIVFTTSFESMKKAINEVKTKAIEEQIGQLFIIGFEGKTITPQLVETFRKYKPGGVLLLSKNIESAEQLKNLNEGLQTLSLKETGLPLFIAVDQEGGVISRIGFTKEKTAQSEIADFEKAFQVGLERGRELKELGVNLNLAPVLDIAESEADFLFNRTFQKDSDETGDLAKSLISGQKAEGVLTSIKHFPGYGGVTFNPEGELATLEKIPEISQFKKAMEANPELVMTANVIYEDLDAALPFTFSQKAIQFLKTNLGNQVLIISDDLDQNSLLEKFSLKEIMKKPIEVGIDILIFSGYRLPAEQGLDAFLLAFKNGEISQEKINSAITRIIQLKQNLLK